MLLVCPEESQSGRRITPERWSFLLALVLNLKWCAGGRQAKHRGQVTPMEYKAKKIGMIYS